MIATSPQSRSPLFASRLSLAMLLLLVRVVASLLPMPPSPAIAGLVDPVQAVLAGEVICHADTQTGGPHDQAPLDHPGGHVHDCGLCPLCHGLSAPALLASGPPDLVANTPPLAGRHDFTPPATGPPSPARAAASPRGPPTVSV